MGRRAARRKGHAMLPCPVTLTRIADLQALGVDTIIDVRSPAEYAEDHLPGAINLPVLDDDQRARVGTIYKQQSPFAARKLGAALIAANAARHLQGPLAGMPGGWQPLVYCWRGGQRSGSLALILAQVGWRVSVLQGGWKAWRRLVHAALYEAECPAPVILLDGDTGTAKTALLARIAALGAQVIDLEGLARHRGSIFGALPEGQPAQKAFESALAQQLARLDPTRPVLIEAESARIGALRLPPTLWKAMQRAPRIEITAPLSARARYLARDYADLAAEPDRLAEQIAGLSPLHPKERIAEWLELARSGALEPLAAGLMLHHYDPRYRRLRQQESADLDITADSLDAPELCEIARRICAAMSGRQGFGPS